MYICIYSYTYEYIHLCVYIFVQSARRPREVDYFIMSRHRNLRMFSSLPYIILLVEAGFEWSHFNSKTHAFHHYFNISSSKS